MVAGAWGLKLDAKDFTKDITRAELGLQQRNKLHERLVIRAQQVVAKRFKGIGPPLGGLTLETRRGSAPLQDEGDFRLSLTGEQPSAKIGTAADTLNSANDSEGVIGSKKIQARLLNFGGVVRAKNAKNLAIPVSREAKGFKSPRQFPRPLHWVPERGDDDTASGWLAEEKKSRRKGWRQLVYHYLLTPQVTVPPRPVLPTNEEFRPEANKVTDRYLTELTTGKKPPQESI